MGKKRLTMEQFNKPDILHEGAYTKDELLAFKKARHIIKEYDVYEKQCEELFEILYPEKKRISSYQQEEKEFIAEKKGDMRGSWVYFPWNGYCVHILNDTEYTKIRTNRNKNIITEKEQKTLLDFSVGVVGLSIGSSIATSLVYTGIARSMKLADFDILSTSNLNRVRARVFDVGEPKVNLAAQQIYEINPYAQLTIYSDGLKKEGLSRFFTDPPIQLIFDAIDDFEMKIRLRMEARNKKIPVVMLTNLGDNVLIDIERYDLDPKLPLFNGLIGTIPEEILDSKISEKEKQRFAVRLVGMEYVPKRALESLFEINKTLVGRPQLASTVTVAGGIAAYIVRMIALQKKIQSGRRYVMFQDILQQESIEDKDRVLVEKKFTEIFESEI